MRYITKDDIIDFWSKINQRGIQFITSKINLNEVNRAKTAFNHLNIQSSNWWIVPKVKGRWNYMVTGNKNEDFVDFTVHSYLSDKQNLKMLSLGSGNCASEIKFASSNKFKEVVCTDISDILLKQAELNAKSQQLNNIKFNVQNANNFSFPKKYYDIVYFRASLHHFKNIEELIGELVKNTLIKDGYLIIDEYVGPNRLQYSKEQLNAINQALKLIPKKYRKRYKSNSYKNRVYGSGIIRMKIADPSECIESKNILPTIHNNYDTIFEANYGGNILMTALKDIAHHFIVLNEEKTLILNKLFDFEDDYLKKYSSDFVFGIYKPKL